MGYIIRNQAVLEKAEIENVFKGIDETIGKNILFASLSDLGQETNREYFVGTGLKALAQYTGESLASYKSPFLKKKSLLSFAAPLGTKKYAKEALPRMRLSKNTEKEIEEIVAEKWRYLVMNFGGEFLTEIRPDKCFMHNEKLSDKLVLYKDKKFSLNYRVLEDYLKSNNGPGLVQVHLTDIMFNPKTKDYDIFSITSGEVEKANIFLDLADFLHCYNKGKDIVIPLHLPYYEEWKTTKGVKSFGSLGENGKRDACFLAEKLLRHLESKWKRKNIKLALENGFGECKINGNTIYALIHEPFLLKFLKQGREDFVTFCEDVGHLNLIDKSDWTEYLTEKIGEFHVSGNNGASDEHMIATPKTLKNYKYIMSFLKFFPSNICTEMKRGDLTIEEFVQGVKGIVETLFTKPNKIDYSNLSRIEKNMQKREEKINKENLNKEKYRDYKKAVSVAKQ